ncbi:response regulator [Paracidobacterium acidisoli]|uniref:Response regulator n=1 Tax=Paracidobacterium acidisoli TaxID=2303751 RepID=A0A372IRI7_9BACT|nr:response regulator [Paracidobacterium acidisoli]MBT9330442.1 response regulator [Paracidobacterium acidisoli]
MPDENTVPTSKVLIVDDEAIIADTLQAIFMQAHYEARTAGNVEEAIAIAEAWQPDLAIVDVIVPRMSGADLALLLKGLCPDIHVLFFSGKSVSSDLLDQVHRKNEEFELLVEPARPPELLHFASRLLHPGCEA